MITSDRARSRSFFAPSTGRQVRAVVFDAFGTLVNWRTGISAALTQLLPEVQTQQHGAELADAWRGRYQPSMQEIRAGRRPYTTLDTLHRENLITVLEGAGISEPDPAVLSVLVAAWHRLPAWPDSQRGLARLRSTHRIAPLSNAQTALLITLSRHAGFVWDAVIGSDIAGAYKPDPRAYLAAAALFDLEAGEIMLVAAHNDDLTGARRAGLATAFLSRPTEHGHAQATDLAPTEDWDVVAQSVNDIAHVLQQPVGR